MGVASRVRKKRAGFEILGGGGGETRMVEAKMFR